MSWDFSSQSRACDHFQILERYVLDAFDFRTLHLASDPSLNMRAPINGAAMTRVFLKGIQCPPNDPLYGYTIMADPARVEAGYTFSKILFNHPVRLTRPLLEVSYITRQGFCLQCNATGQVNDWSISPSGSLDITQGVQKLAQQSLKYVLTSKNPFSPTLVCHMKDYIGKKFNMNVSTTDIASEITRVLQTYQQIQGTQKTVQTLDPQEVLRDIQTVSAQVDPANPNLIFVSIVVTAYGSPTPVPLNIALQAQS